MTIINALCPGSGGAAAGSNNVHVVDSQHGILPNPETPLQSRS